MIEDQFGFQKGKGTRVTIGLMRIIFRSMPDVKEDMSLSFIDWQKDLDRADWTKTAENI